MSDFLAVLSLTVLFVVGLGCIAGGIGFFVLDLWDAWKNLKRDARRWREGQKPIGRILSMEEDDEGLKVNMELVSGVLPKPEMSAFSIGPKVDVPPKPEWEVKDTFFTIHRDEMLDMKPSEWQLLVTKMQRLWLEMLKNDGYHVADVVTCYTEEVDGLIYGYQKVIFEVKVYKEE